MIRTTRAALGRALLFLAFTLIAAPPTPLEAASEGQVNIAAHVALAPRWLDPAETESAISPFMILYALHDAAACACSRRPTRPWSRS